MKDLFYWLAQILSHGLQDWFSDWVRDLLARVFWNALRTLWERHGAEMARKAMGRLGNAGKDGVMARHARR